MNVEHIIMKKRDGEALNEQEIRYLVKGCTDGDIPDYQVSAFLMAVYFQEMNLEETFILTKMMIESGETIRFSNLNKKIVDKHSTGGVGDKISLVLAPLVAAAGVAVPMISGRGLGHTGGTLDKLEAIPGFRTDLSGNEFIAQVESIGLAMIGQSERIVPADRKIYALRDQTATVASIPLVVASILSKKIAEGIESLVLDVKTGRGAFFKNKESAENLARNLIKIGKRFNLPVTALMTNMEQPLGHAVGNWLETREAIDTLRGKGPADIERLTLALGSEMLKQARVVHNRNEGQEKLSRLISSGAGLEKFIEMVRAQGGDVSVIENPRRYSMKIKSIPIRSTISGYIQNLDAFKIGQLAMETGAGRKKISDEIDPSAGVLLYKKKGDYVEKNEALAELFTSKNISSQYWQATFLHAVEISQSRHEIYPLIHSIINEKGKNPWPF